MPSNKPLNSYISSRMDGALDWQGETARHNQMIAALCAKSTARSFFGCKIRSHGRYRISGAIRGVNITTITRERGWRHFRNRRLFGPIWTL